MDNSHIRTGGIFGLLAGNLCLHELPALHIESAAFAVVGMADLLTAVTGTPFRALAVVIEMPASLAMLMPCMRCSRRLGCGMPHSMIHCASGRCESSKVTRGSNVKGESMLGNERLELHALFNLTTVATLLVFFVRDRVSPCPS
jgi:hypothetical protein